ncbi:MAG: hypothetical protein HC854_13925 [Flavobacterium sp.]|nr:hypothetical protein [Flavobacterium sp.]
MLNNKHNHFTNQSKVCLRVIERIYRRVNEGFYFGDVKVDFGECLIIDGNHRYIAYSLANIEFGMVPSVKNFCDKSPYKEIKDIVVDIENDWDLNNPTTIRFCTDDFINNDIEKYIRK